MMDQMRERLGRVLGRRPAALQVAALCIDPASERLLLVTSRGTGRWILPKGWPMPGRTLPGAAAQEAWEEAGVRGRVIEREIGTYRYDKKQDRGFGIPVQVHVFGIVADELCDNYPESSQRKRGWFSPEKAAGLVEETELRMLLKKLAVRTVLA